MKSYSTKEVSQNLLEEIKKALTNIRWGSLEIFVQDSFVVQITERNIKKLENHEQENKKQKPH